MSRRFWKTADLAPPLDQPEHRKPRDIFGGSSPSGSTQTQTISKSDPWSGVQPYLSQGFQGAQDLYGRGPYSGSYLAQQSPFTQQAIAGLAQRGAMGSPYGAAAQQTLTDTASGKYLDPASDPHFSSAVNDALGLAKSQYTGMYGGSAGSQLSNSGFQEGLQRNLGQIATNAYSQQFNANRQQQLGAAQLAPAFQNADYQNLAALQDAGAQQEARGQAEIGAQQQQYQAPWANLGQYSQALQGGLGFGQQSGSASQPYFQNPAANMLGLGIGGAALYGMGNSSGLFGALGGLFGGGGGAGILGAAPEMAVFSDVRLKENVERVGTMDDSELGIYRYNYKGDGTTHIGVLAQEVEKVKPEAVTEVAGFKAVNYKML